jgi:hypothetical protein
VLRKFSCWTAYADRFGGEFCREPFIQRNIAYEPAERTASEIYRDFLPMLNSSAVTLLDHRRMRQQFLALERRSTRGGRDVITHPPAGHDDISVAVGGACLAAMEHAGAIPMHRLQSQAIDSYDTLASASENAIAAEREERRGGYFTGPGHAPTWHEDEQQQTRALD